MHYNCVSLLKIYLFIYLFITLICFNYIRVLVIGTAEERAYFPRYRYLRNCSSVPQLKSYNMWTEIP
jgi:hypothetical protein